MPGGGPCCARVPVNLGSSGVAYSSTEARSGMWSTTSAPPTMPRTWENSLSWAQWSARADGLARHLVVRV